MSESDGDSSPYGDSEHVWFECAYVINCKFPIPKCLVSDGLEVGDLVYHPDLLQDGGFEIDFNATPTMTLRFKDTVSNPFMKGLTQKVVALWQSYDYKWEQISDNSFKQRSYQLSRE
jgi:hypothetical protein